MVMHRLHYNETKKRTINTSTFCFVLVPVLYSRNKNDSGPPFASFVSSWTIELNWTGGKMQKKNVNKA